MPLLFGCESRGDGGSAAGELPAVPECEQYFQRAEACFAKNPVAKATLGEGVNQVKGMLRNASGQPLERSKMIDLCKQKMAALAESCN